MFTNELFPDEENSTQGDGDGGGGYQYGGDTSATPAPPPPGGGTVGEPVDPSGGPPPPGGGGGTWNPCYCNQILIIDVLIQWSNSFNPSGTSISTFKSSFDGIWGGGCDDTATPTDFSKTLDYEGWTSDGGFADSGYIMIKMRRQDTYGECDLGAPGNVPGVTMHPSANICSFVWGSFLGSVYESENCVHTVIKTGVGAGASTAVCVKQGWAQGIKDELTGLIYNRPGSWDKVNKAIFDMMGSTEGAYGWETPSSMKAKCEELQAK
mgnify:FL=1